MSGEIDVPKLHLIKRFYWSGAVELVKVAPISARSVRFHYTKSCFERLLWFCMGVVWWCTIKHFKVLLFYFPEV